MAGPVFREIADKLNASYVNKAYATGRIIMYKDSSSFYYAANTSDVKQILQTMQMAYKDSVGGSEWSSVYAGNDQTIVYTKPVAAQGMPNLKGMGLKDALFLLEKMNLSVVPVGKGRVVKQSVDPGGRVPKSGITLWLN